MAIPSLTDLVTYVNTKLTGSSWNSNWQQLITWLTDGNADITVDTVTGDVTGNLTGNVTGNVTGDLTGTAFGTMKRIYSGTLAAAATSISVTGLAGDTDIFYNMKIMTIPGTTGGNCYLQFNTDTGNNYGRQTLLAATTSVTGSQTTATDGIDFLNSANGACFSNIDIYAKTGTYRTTVSTSTSGVSTTTVSNIETVGGVWSNTTSEITSLQFKCDVADGLGVGTIVELYARR